MHMISEQIRQLLLPPFAAGTLFDSSESASTVPTTLGERGSDAHLAYLTLGYTISSGRSDSGYWQTLANAAEVDAELFDPRFLAYVNPKKIQPRLRATRITSKPSLATVWQRIGQALVMRAKGSVQTLLTDHDYDAIKLMAMLADSKTTFPMLSGEQTAPRWLAGLAREGAQPLSGVQMLQIAAVRTAMLAMDGLQMTGETLPADLFDPLTQLGAVGCKQHVDSVARCPVAADCPIAQLCRFA